MNADESANGTLGSELASSANPPSPLPPPPVPPWWLEPVPPPPTGLYLGLACLGSMVVAVVLLFTPWFDLFFPVFLAAVPLGAAGIASASQDTRRRGLIVSVVGTTIATMLLVLGLALIVIVLENGFAD